MLTKLLVFLTVTYLAIALAMLFGQRKLVYVPDRLGRVDPAAMGLSGVSELTIESGDGARAIAWYAKAAPGQPTLLYFHGNAGSLSSRSERIRKYKDRGRGILMMSYRGYSGGTGSPSEDANVADAKRAYNLLVAGGVKPEDIIIYGESLGSGVAVQVAAEKKAAGLILDAPYTSLADVAAGHYPWLPVRGMLFDRYESARHIRSVHVPLLIVHGERDTTIPAAMGKALYEAANVPKELKIIVGAGHADHHLFGSYDVINAWIDKLH